MDKNELFDQIADMFGDMKTLPVLARVEGQRLAETWISEVEQFDAQYQTLAVEVPWFMFVDKFTVVVGVQDRIAMDKDGRVFGCEWKTAKGTTRFWNEEKWLEKIRTGAQIGIYALAQREGYFVADLFDWPKDVPEQSNSWKAERILPSLGASPLVQLSIKNPMVMVRAITKESPPQIWPSEGQYFQEISPARLKATKAALIVRGAAIREARLSKMVPWQLPGLQCENRFSHTMCPLFEKYCKKNEYLSTEEAPGMIGQTDPGLAALLGAQEMLRVPLSDPRVVVLSASSYEASGDCLERWRVEGEVGEEHYYQDELDKGTALHAALKVFYGGTK